MKSIQDRIELNNGYKIPCVGFGTYNASPEEAEEAVAAAIRAGYRHIDGAAFYGNETGVGAGIRNSGIPREEIFVTGKVWKTDRGYDRTMAAFEKSLKDLGLEYLDLYLIHWPANYLVYGDDWKKVNRDTWKALEELYRAGRIKAIGVSNVLAHHLEALLETADIVPAVNQIELHPGWYQRSVLKYCRDHGILCEAWSPMGRKEVLDNETITALAEKYKKTPAQICIRWVLQHGAVPLPKSVHPERMKSNGEVFDFELSAEDMALLDRLENIGGRCLKPDEQTE